MSMGYDEDDPRREQVRQNFALGIYKVPEGKKPNVSTRMKRGGRRTFTVGNRT